jgi:hypothetical protein
MKLYSNTTLRTLSIEGNTQSDKAINTWTEMNFMERFEIMQQVKGFKNIALRQRACINYIAEFVL